MHVPPTFKRHTTKFMEQLCWGKQLFQPVPLAHDQTIEHHALSLYKGLNFIAIWAKHGNFRSVKISQKKTVYTESFWTLFFKLPFYLLSRRFVITMKNNSRALKDTSQQGV